MLNFGNELNRNSPVWRTQVELPTQKQRSRWSCSLNA